MRDQGERIPPGRSDDRRLVDEHEKVTNAFVALALSSIFTDALPNDVSCPVKAQKAHDRDEIDDGPVGNAHSDFGWQQSAGTQIQAGQSHPILSSAPIPAGAVYGPSVSHQPIYPVMHNDQACFPPVASREQQTTQGPMHSAYLPLGFTLPDWPPSLNLDSAWEMNPDTGSCFGYAAAHEPGAAGGDIWGDMNQSNPTDLVSGVGTNERNNAAWSRWTEASGVMPSVAPFAVSPRAASRRMAPLLI
jgi:hypothetical protein